MEKNTHTAEYERTMLEKMSCLVNSQKFQDWYCIGCDVFDRPRVYLRADLENYEQTVTLNICGYLGPEYHLSLHHRFPCPGDDASVKIGRGDGKIDTLKSEGFRVVYAKNIRMAASLSKQFWNMRYGKVIKREPATINPELSKALQELSTNHYKDPSDVYGQKLLDTLLQHTR